jgi:predicted transcriptional regulator
MRRQHPQHVALPADLAARVDAAAAVLDTPKARIYRRALTAYLDGLPQDVRDAMAAHVPTVAS